MKLDPFNQAIILGLVKNFPKKVHELPDFFSCSWFKHEYGPAALKMEYCKENNIDFNLDHLPDSLKEKLLAFAEVAKPFGDIPLSNFFWAREDL